jgi:cellulose synthase/poly-beta-1,6-N-acetylglucosamine synthase-like glycosyltransferase
MFLFTIFAIVLVAVYGVLIAYYQAAWNAIPVFRSGRPVDPTVFISVLVPARNEEKNIGPCLQSLARQSFPQDRFEVIVIDDHSTDSTADIVKAWGKEVQYLDLAGQPRGPVIDAAGTIMQPAAAMVAHKKRAIEAGVRIAKGGLIVTTDADCRFHPDWLQTIAAFYRETGAKFIAAPVRIAGSGGLLHLFQTLDFITLQGITGAAVHKRFHSMCNGANLAYEKKAFEEVKGFSGIDAIPSGDDMLLMHKIYSRYPGHVFFLKCRSAVVDTQPETQWKGFFNQRIRWASKAGHYDDKRIFWVLVLLYAVNLLFAVLWVIACWDPWWLWIALLLLMVKTAVEFPFVRSVAAFFDQQRLMLYFPWLQPLHILYTLVIGGWGQFGPYRWKDRKITAL